MVSVVVLRDMLWPLIFTCIIITSFSIKKKKKLLAKFTIFGHYDTSFRGPTFDCINIICFVLIECIFIREFICLLYIIYLIKLVCVSYKMHGILITKDKLLYGWKDDAEGRRRGTDLIQFGDDNQKQSGQGWHNLAAVMYDIDVLTSFSLPTHPLKTRWSSSTTLLISILADAFLMLLFRIVLGNTTNGHHVSKFDVIRYMTSNIGDLA